MNYKLYQIRRELLNTNSYVFMGWSFAKNEGFSIKDYQIVYEGEVESGRWIEDTLENIWTKFNIDRPEDFKGWSMSVSDIIQIGGEYYYTDGCGFKNITYEVLKQL